MKRSPLGQGDLRANSDLVLGQLHGDMAAQVSNLVINLDVLLQESFLTKSMKKLIYRHH